MSIDLTPERTLELLRRAVAEKGADYVYPRAKRPGCLYRDVLLWAGADPDEIREGGGAFDVAFELGVTNRRILDALQEAQDAQDHGDTWSEALAAAEWTLTGGES